MPDNSPRTTTQRLVQLFADLGVSPGSKIPTELELCQMLGASRPVIREGLSVLEANGLLAVRKGSGRVLMPFDFSTALAALASQIVPKGRWLIDLLALRQVMECNFLPLAAPKITSDDYRVLEEVTAAMERKAHCGEYFGEEDRTFHLTLYRGLDNQVLNGLLELFWLTYEQLGALDLEHSQRLEETAAHHRRILDALVAGDVRKAQYHMDTHFYDTTYVLSHNAAPMSRETFSDR